MHDVPASGQFPVDNGHQYMHDGQWTSPFGFQTLNTSASSNQYYRSVGDKIMKTLPEAQRTQGIESITLVISPAK